MDVARATSELAGSRFARIQWLDETGSTNADLLAVARGGASEQVLGADHQTAGRGRLGRAWVAPPGASVLCSVLVRPTEGVDPHSITTALGLAAAEAISEVAGIDVGIKWPNDLVAGTSVAPDDRKLSGVLAESVVADGRVAAVVVGIGLNVNWPDELPADLAETATSLRHLVGHDVDPTDLVVAMLRRFEAHLANPSEVRAAVEARSATVGRRVRIERSSGDRSADLVGEAVGLTSDGRLVVRDDSGNDHDIAVGDVIHLRPEPTT